MKNYSAMFDSQKFSGPFFSLLLLLQFLISFNHLGYDSVADKIQSKNDECKFCVGDYICC
ncbi:unnamed protein product, partial [Vitis vinifera]